MDRHVNLGEPFDAFIDEAVSTGRYGSADDVLRESIRLLQEQEERADDLELRIARSIADAEAGRLHDAEEVFDRLERKYRAMADARTA